MSSSGAAAGAAQRGKMVFRSLEQVLGNVAVALVFVAVVAGNALEVGHVEPGGVPFAVVGAVLMARAVVLRVVVTEADVVVHSWWRTLRFARTEITDMRPGAYDGAWVRGSASGFWCQLRLTTRDGREHHLRAVVTRASTGAAAAFCDKVMGRTRAGARHVTGPTS